MASSPAFPDCNKEPSQLHDIKMRGVDKLLVRDYGDRLELVSLMVDPDHQNEGLGTAAVQLVQKQFNKPIHLIANAEKGKRGKLLAFYGRLGFKIQPDNTLLWSPPVSHQHGS